MNLLKDYFTYKLTEAGICVDEVYWSLNSCQGDGMCFEGSLDLEKALPNFLPEHLLVASPLIQRIARVSIKHRDSHYYHYNTMSVDLECDFCEDEQGNAPRILTLASEHFSEDAVSEYVKDLSRGLERDGYALQEACQYWEDDQIIVDRILGGRRIVVSTLDEDDYSPMEDVGDNDPEGLKSALQEYEAMLNGEQKVCCLKVAIYESNHEDWDGRPEFFDDEEPVATHYLGHYCFDPRITNVYKRIPDLRDVVSEAIHELRPSTPQPQRLAA